MQESMNGSKELKKSITNVTMTVSEVASVIGVGRTTVYSMVRENQIPYVRVRSRILFHADVIDKWLRGTAQDSSF
ncbi:helix-turn-helix domain-containing protein [Alicyclobacillus sp. SP_1]|uniref:helix-turn-helix domain-containing protein n=1 Tax=Alicyclobacillus sp. SP_1 TaxID=2942475 RepID=UPI0021580970|nr:helix-turn-helix domain-containing protein [Alicyclobacillus sp. SP_1]